MSSSEASRWDSIRRRIDTLEGRFARFAGALRRYRSHRARPRGHSLPPDSAALPDREGGVPAYDRTLLEQLQESRENYDALAEACTEAIFRIDESFRIIFANSAVRPLFGFTAKELEGRYFGTLFPSEIFARHKSDFRKYFSAGTERRGGTGPQDVFEMLGRHRNGGVLPMEVSFGSSRGYGGNTLTCIVRDITRKKNLERSLRYLTFHDKLTGLGNRDLFLKEIGAVLDARQAQAHPGRSDDHSALLFLDLDDFKQMNDSLGHGAGDEILVETARRLRECLHENDSLFRLGGDEFLVLLRSIRRRRDAAAVARAILSAVRRPFTLPGIADQGDLNAGVSIGIALIPENGSDVETVIRNADLAMYRAKEAGKNRFAFFTRHLEKKASTKWEIEQGMKSALAGGEFRIFYQPLVDGEGAIRGVEALLRWFHPLRGEIPPGQFIPIAEESGLIIPVGTWVLETACRDIARWNANGYPDLYVSVNLSTRQFERRDLVHTVAGIIRRTKANPANLKLEITETCIMNNPEAAITRMRTLKKRHPPIDFAIDDFGTGYSSLSYLSRLPADILKIDISFVTKLFSPHNEKIVNAIINLAHSLGLRIVAEGVENADQWRYFTDRGCSTLQGFHFSRAVDSTAMEALLRRGRLPV